jgi:hypothetical protein
MDKCINFDEFLGYLIKVDLKQTLMRLYQEGTEFVIGVPTKLERCKASKTAYVGKLSDGEPPSYWLMVLSTPFRGRSIPFLGQTLKNNS